MSPPDRAPSAAAIVYVWVPDEPGLATGDQAERTHDHCDHRGWRVVAEIQAHRFPELTRLTQAFHANGAGFLVIAREALDNLERHFPDAWRGARTRIEAGGAAVVVV